MIELLSTVRLQMDTMISLIFSRLIFFNIVFYIFNH